MQRTERNRGAVSGQPNALGHFSHDADVCVRMVPSRHEEHTRVFADVDCEGHGHAREHHGVVERDKSQPVHSGIRIGPILDNVNYLFHQV